jgi:malate synthase
MAAQIPIKDDPVANEQALAKVRADKQREATDGHDGTWVAHPELVPVAREIFDRVMQSSNQLHRKRQDVAVSAKDLLTVPEGQITETGLLSNISVALQYLAAWLSGNGCVPINNLMEDAATAEISRAQIWQWTRHPKGVLADGRRVTLELFRAGLAAEEGRLQSQLGEKAYAAGNFRRAAQLLEQITAAKAFPAFLTLVAYPALEQ